MTKIVLVAMVIMAFINSSSAAIYVENLPASMTSEELENIFSDYGKVMKVQLVEENESVVASFVHMGNFSMEKNALKELQGKKIKGNKIKLSQAKARSYEHDVLIP